MTEQTKTQRSLDPDILTSSGSASLEADGLETAEQRMRHALGLGGGALPGNARPADRAPPSAKPRVPEAGVAHRRHRFVQDGEVPVVHVVRRTDTGAESPSPGVNRLQAAEAQIQAERTGRERAERALQTAQVAIHELKTKLGHAELALAEVQTQARSQAAELEALRTAQSHAQSQLAVAEAARRSSDEAAQEALTALRQEITARKAAELSANRKTLRAASLPEKAGLAKGAAIRKPRATKHGTEAKSREPQPVKWWLASKSKQRSSRQTRS